MRNCSNTSPRTRIERTAAVLLISVVAGCATTEQSRQADPEAPPGFDATVAQDWSAFIESRPGEGVYFGGQPTDAALDAFKDRGGSVVLNLKTEQEMAANPGYQAAVESRGMTYLHVPTDPNAMGPASADAFRNAMAMAELQRGPILVHCQASGRALYALAMDKVERGEMTAVEAIAWARWMRRGDGWQAGEDALRATAASNNP